MTASSVNAGGERESFWWYILVFDNYFMIVKGVMFSAFLCTLLPRPEKGHLRFLYVLLAMMWPLFSFLIQMFLVGCRCSRFGACLEPYEAQLPDWCFRRPFAWMPLCLYTCHTAEVSVFLL